MCYFIYLKRLYKFYLVASPAFFIYIALTIICPITIFYISILRILLKSFSRFY